MTYEYGLKKKKNLLKVTKFVFIYDKIYIYAVTDYFSLYMPHILSLIIQVERLFDRQ